MKTPDVPPGQILVRWQASPGAEVRELLIDASKDDEIIERIRAWLHPQAAPAMPLERSPLAATPAPSPQARLL